MKSGSEIPDAVRRLFWDSKKESIDTNLHRSYIISRIIDCGDVEDVKWMLKTFSRKEIIEVVKRRRGLSRKSAIFWSTYLDIPVEEIECLKMLYCQK